MDDTGILGNHPELPSIAIVVNQTLGGRNLAPRLAFALVEGAAPLGRGQNGPLALASSLSRGR